MEPIYPNCPDNCMDTEDTFEQRFSTRTLRMLKIVTPFLPQNIQPGLAAMIRMQELTHVLSSLRTQAPVANVSASEQSAAVTPVHSLSDLLQPDTLNRILNRLSPLLSPHERSELAKIQKLMQMLETYKQLEPLMSMFSEMANANREESSSGTGDTAQNSTASDFSSGFSPDMLMGMLSPDMLQNAGPLMQIFSALQSTSFVSDDSHPADTDIPD